MEMVTTNDGTVTIEEMRKEVNDSFRAYYDNKERVSDLNSSNTNITKYLDEKYRRKKGTTKAYFDRKIKQELGKDVLNDVIELEEDLKRSEE